MQQERAERLLAMILLNQMQEASQGQKADVLRRVGFTNSEIADMLGTTPAVVGQQLYAMRAGKSVKQKPPSTTSAAKKKKR